MIEKYETCHIEQGMIVKFTGLYMKKIILLTVFMIITGIAGAAIASEESRISIASPENGDVITGSEVQLALTLPPEGGHVHLYLDGQMKYMADSKDLPSGKMTVKDLTKGEHILKVVLGKQHVEHSGRNYEDSVRITVK